MSNGIEILCELVRVDSDFLYIIIIIFFYSSRDASLPEICFWYTVYCPGPVQETVRDVGFELGTAA
jgi:hypothetical protein